MIKNIEAYDMVRDHLTQHETWKEEEVPGNLRDECLIHSREATWVWGEDNTLESAATQLSEMDARWVGANFVAVEHDGTWLAVSTLETSAIYISMIYQHMEREEDGEKEREDYLAQIESLRKKIHELKGKEQ